MTSFRTPIWAISFLNENIYFCPQIAESVIIAENAQHRRIYSVKNFRRY